MFRIGGSPKTREIVDALEPFFTETGGTRVLGKISFELKWHEGDYTISISANLGGHNGPAIDLKKGAEVPDDARVQEVLRALIPFTDEEVAEAISDTMAWDYLPDREYGSDPGGEHVAHSIGNANFAGEAVIKVAELVNKLA